MASTKVDPGATVPVTACCAPVGSIDFDEAVAAELAKGFHALADPVRLHLLSMITAAGSVHVLAPDEAVGATRAADHSQLGRAPGRGGEWIAA